MTGREGSHRGRAPDPGETRRRRAGVRSVLPLVAWLATLVVAIVLFTRLGAGPLAAPPVADPGEWGRWAADREPVVATVALLRLLVLALAWYLVGVTTIGAVARVARLTALVRVADALSVPTVRRVLQTSLGVGLATAVVAASAPGMVASRPVGAASAGAASSSTPTMQALPSTPPTGNPDDADDAPPAMQPLADLATRATPPSPAPTSPAPPGMRPLPPPPATTAPAATPSPTATSDPTTPPDPMTPPDPVPVDTREPAPAGADADGATWTVRSGEHLWAIAEAHLRETLGRAPDDRVVADYWHRLVEANRGRLLDPDDADLVVPGQRFVLPDVEVGG